MGRGEEGDSWRPGRSELGSEGAPWEGAWGRGRQGGLEDGRARSGLQQSRPAHPRQCWL